MTFANLKLKKPAAKYVGYRYSSNGGIHHNVGWFDGSLQFRFNEALSMYYFSAEKQVS